MFLNFIKEKLGLNFEVFLEIINEKIVPV